MFPVFVFTTVYQLYLEIVCRETMQFFIQV